MSSQFEKMRNFGMADLSEMQAMVAAGTIPDVNAPYDESGFTVIQLLCEHRDIESMRFLLACNPPANLNKKDTWRDRGGGCASLHWAISSHGGGRDDPDLVRLLLENGADCSMKNNNGYTALSIAKMNKFNKSISVICDWYQSRYEDILYPNDLTEIPRSIHPFDSLLKAILVRVTFRGRLLSLFILLNHKNSYDGFVDSLENEHRKELMESLVLEML